VSLIAGGEFAGIVSASVAAPSAPQASLKVLPLRILGAATISAAGTGKLPIAGGKGQEAGRRANRELPIPGYPRKSRAATRATRYRCTRLALGLCQRELQIHLQRRTSPMLKYYIKTTEALKRLRTDEDGVVSFEYIIVAVCIIGAVSAVFGVGAGGAIGQSLTAGITAITNAFTAAV